MDVSLAEIALVNMMTYDEHDYNVMGLGNSMRCHCCDRQCFQVGRRTSSEIQELLFKSLGERLNQTPLWLGHTKRLWKSSDCCTIHTTQLSVLHCEIIMSFAHNVTAQQRGEASTHKKKPTPSTSPNPSALQTEKIVLKVVVFCLFVCCFSLKVNGYDTGGVAALVGWSWLHVYLVALYLVKSLLGVSEH